MPYFKIFEYVKTYKRLGLSCDHEIDSETFYYLSEIQAAFDKIRNDKLNKKK